MTTRAPRKYTDTSRSEITDEWKTWFDERQEMAVDELEDFAASLGLHPEDLWPERYDKDLGSGTWVIVIDEPVTEMVDRFRVPTPSLWWARPEASRAGGFKHRVLGVDHPIPGPYRAVIETPGGSLWLYPREYIVCQDPLPLITDPECTIHPLGGRPTLDEDQREQMFYLQSRGVSHRDAFLMLMANLDMRDWGWVEFPEYARAMFEGVGRKVVLA